MGEPVTPLSPQVELDGVEGPAHGRIERGSQRARRLERDTAGTRLHPGKSGGIDLHDTQSRVERNRRRVRAGRARADDDEVEVVHTWEIGNGGRRTTSAGYWGSRFTLRSRPFWYITACVTAPLASVKNSTCASTTFRKNFVSDSAKTGNAC